MGINEIPGAVIFFGFGLWWIFFPESVRKFYTWLHKGKANLPGPVAIRIIGVIWLLVLILVGIFRP